MCDINHFNAIAILNIEVSFRNPNWLIDIEKIENWNLWGNDWFDESVKQFVMMIHHYISKTLPDNAFCVSRESASRTNCRFKYLIFKLVNNLLSLVKKEIILSLTTFSVHFVRLHCETKTLTLKVKRKICRLFWWKILLDRSIDRYMK